MQEVLLRRELIHYYFMINVRNSSAELLHEQHNKIMANIDVTICLVLLI